MHPVEVWWAHNLGTLISMTRKPIREVLHPVYARLEDEASLLRRSGDVSMLVQALLDVCESSSCTGMLELMASCRFGHRGVLELSSFHSTWTDDVDLSIVRE